MLALLLATLFAADLTVKAGNHTVIDSPVTYRTVTVESGGFLEVLPGAEINFEDSPIDTAADPDQLGHGLVVYGKLAVKGPRTEPYARVTADLLGGTSFLPLAKLPEGWGPGDTIYIPDTRQPDHPFNPAGTMQGVTPLQQEFRTILQATNAGILLDAPLTFAHMGARDADGKLMYLPVIANLTRSIVFRSANPNGVRAHCIFMMRADVSIEGAAFLDMGRTTNEKIDDTVKDAVTGKVLKHGTNPKGRYALHWHHCMGPLPDPTRDYQFRCVNNVIWSQQPKSRWGITVHHTHYGLVAENVVVTCGGSGIVTEDGNEVGNVFERNYVAHVTGESRPDARQNEIAFEGAGFWFRGGNNVVQYNHVYSTQLAYTHYARFAPTSFKYPSIPGGMEDVPNDPVRIPLRKWRGNEGCNCQNGFATWWIGFHDRTPIETIGESVVEDQVSWHVRGPVSAYECSRFRYINMVSIGDKNKSSDSNGGWGASDYGQFRCSIEGGRIENYNSGIRVPSITDKLDATGTNPGLFVVRNTRLRCRTNLTVPVPWHNATAKRLPPITVHLENVSFEPLMAKGQKHVVIGKSTATFSNYPQWVSVWYQSPSLDDAIGWHLQFFGINQEPTYVLPASSADGRIVGAPVATANAQAWPLYGLSGGGEITQGNIRIPEIDGSMRFVDEAPYIRPIPDITLHPGQSWNYGVCAYDPSLGELDYSVKGPVGMGIENRSGKINWTAPNAEGVHPVTIEARDVDTQVLGTRSFTIGVRMPPG